MMNMINSNNLNNFSQLVENFKKFKIICSSLSINTEIIVGVSGITLIIAGKIILCINFVKKDLANILP